MFRTKDIWTGEEYYSKTNSDINKHSAAENYIGELSSNSTGMSAYPFVETKTGLCMDTDSIRTYTIINPGTEIVVPIKCQYYFDDKGSISELSRTISFDLRTSLYSDPINYTFKIVCKNNSTTNDKLLLTNKKHFWNRLTNPSKYNITVK
jgi:hypothetical protein